ncbi:MAG: prepilin-type N-terminal cleavage/methylation domain-containing protein [Candidatus Omnitrophica bacterium]|nr:prepilin-type N-terminal cleavage/methylation domain-containing protein [Candidatus Omnitrophota bacterium]
MNQHRVVQQPARLGFSLLELLVVVAILGVLASLAIAQYRRTVELARVGQAEDQLLTIYYGERSYYFTNSDYRAMPANPWRDILMDDPTRPEVTFTVVPVPGVPRGFIATATRQIPGSPCFGRTRTIDQRRIFGPGGGSWRACAQAL